MSEAHSTSSTARSKPAKPSPEFPLFAHAAGVWAKKIRGKLHYFGPWSDPDGALAKYLAEKDALHAGRKPREATEGLTVKELANRFLNAKKRRVDTGELSTRCWNDYKLVCERIVREFGKARLVADLDPEDFAALRSKLAKKWGPYRLGNGIQTIRSVFRFGWKEGLIDREMRYGDGFGRPTKKTIRLHKGRAGAKLFTAEEILDMVRGALVVGKDGPELVQTSAPLRAMILLGINCGFGNADCGRLPLSAVDLEGGWIDFPRPKTGVNRRAPLWPETVQALKEALAHRPEPKEAEDAGLVFVTKYGDAWAKDDRDNPVTKEMAKLLKKLGFNGHRNFYALRHVFRTIADEAKDQPAADHIMGHESPHMSSVYREGISDARLKVVSNYVRAWLFGKPAESPKASGNGEEE